MTAILTWRRGVGMGVAAALALLLASGTPPAMAATYGEAMAWYGTQAETGDAEAQYLLAYALENGVHAQADLEAARDWYAKAADQGHTRAGYRLALMMIDGRGGPRDRDGAQDRLEPLAESGDVPSQSLLGYLLAHDDVEHWTEAYQWLPLAADNGDSFAATNLAHLLRVLSPEDVVEGEALAADWRARHAP
jgi:TPR repeat protein